MRRATPARRAVLSLAAGAATVRRVSRWGRIAACAAILAAFAGLAATAGSPHARAQARCPSQAQVAGLPHWRPGGRLRGDLDGDGRPDTVTVRVARRAIGRCAFYLRVSTAKRTYNWRLGLLVGDLGKTQANEPIRDWPFRIPAVEAIVDLGGHGNRIALGDSEGAANLFVDFVGLEDGRFRLIRMDLGLGGPMTAGGVLSPSPTVLATGRTSRCGGRPDGRGSPGTRCCAAPSRAAWQVPP